jgi:hypothetical protein
MGSKLALVLGRDDDLPHGHAAGLLREGIDEPPVAGARPGPDPWVADRRCADELVEWEVIGLGQGEQ